MPKVKQTKAELIAHLKDAVWFLQASGAAFDAGHLAEAKRLAVSIRVLVHDTSQSKSLLGQLGWQAGRSFLNSALPYDATNLINHHGLVAIKMEPGTGASYCAPLGEGAPRRPYKFVPFPDWWNEVVIVDSNKSKFTRRNLVLTLCNKDGGTHVDPELDEVYAQLTRHNSLGHVYSDGTKLGPILDIERHSVRQIAYEVLESIARMRQKKGDA